MDTVKTYHLFLRLVTRTDAVYPEVQCHRPGHGLQLLLLYLLLLHPTPRLPFLLHDPLRDLTPPPGLIHLLVLLLLVWEPPLELVPKHLVTFRVLLHIFFR